MFTKRTIKPSEVVTSVDTASEALAVSIAEKAKVDMEYIVRITIIKRIWKSGVSIIKIIFRD